MLCEVLLFSQVACPSCSVVYRDLAKHFEVQVVDVHRDRAIARAYGVFGTPVVVFLKDGKEIARHYGVPHENKLLEVKKLCIRAPQG